MLLEAAFCSESDVRLQHRSDHWPACLSEPEASHGPAFELPVPLDRHTVPPLTWLCLHTRTGQTGQCWHGNVGSTHVCTYVCQPVAPTVAIAMFLQCPSDTGCQVGSRPYARSPGPAAAPFSGPRCRHRPERGPRASRALPPCLQQSLLDRTPAQQDEKLWPIPSDRRRVSRQQLHRNAAAWHKVCWLSARTRCSRTFTSTNSMSLFGSGSSMACIAHTTSAFCGFCDTPTACTRL